MAEFDKRLSIYIDELRWLYFELYGENHQAFDYFCGMIRSYYEKRSTILKKWDRKRTENQGWYKDNKRLGMLMYADCFADNIKGVKEHLSYLKETGVNYLHLMPLLKSPEGKSDGGYAVSDFRTVDEKYGSMKDLSALAKECHEEDISICLDFVMNHTSEDHEWALKAKKGDKKAQSRYFFFDDWSVPNEYEKYVPEVFPQTAPGNFTYCAEAGKIVMTTFYPYQWDLNYANPMVFNDMTENMLYLLNRGVDIVRLDATPYIWKKPGTNCRNLREVHSLVRMMRIASEIVAPGTLLLGEVVMEPKEVVPYFGSVEKPECHMLYNVTTMASTWHTVATRDVNLLKHQLRSVFELPKDYIFLNYLRCHDDIGWGLDFDFLKAFSIEESQHKKFLNEYFRGYIYGSEARGELYNDDPRLKDARLCGTTASLCGIEAAEYERDDIKEEAGISLDIMLHAFLFSLSGIPVLYSGDEIGMLNDYSYHEDPLKWDDSRYLHRGKFSWEDAEKRKDRDSREGKIYKAISDLNMTRRKYDVFTGSAETWIVETGNDHVLGIGRYYNGEKFIGLFNFHPFSQEIHVYDDGKYRDIFSKKASDVRNMTIEGFSYKWLLSD